MRSCGMVRCLDKPAQPLAAAHARRRLGVLGDVKRF